MLFMPTLNLTWPELWKNAPAEAEIYDQTNAKQKFFLAGSSEYTSGTTVAAAVLDGAAGTLLGGKRKTEVAADIYLHVSGADNLTIYGGGENASVEGDIFLFLAGGTLKNVYGGARGRGKVGAVSIQIAPGAAITGNVYLGGTGAGAKAESANLTISGENALAGFTGLLNGLYYDAETGKKTAGTLTFSDASVEFNGKLSHFSELSLENSSVTLHQFNRTGNYKNIGKYTIGSGGTLTLDATGKYTVSASFSGSGTLVFTGNAIHSVKAGSSGFEGNLRITSGTTLDMQGSFLSTTTDKAGVTVESGGTFQFSKKTAELKSKLSGEAGSIVSARDVALTISGDITGFHGTFSASGKGSLTLKSDLDAESIPALNLHFDGKKTGSIILASDPEEAVDLHISGTAGKLYLQGHLYNIKTNSAERLTVYGGGSNLVLDFDPASNVMIENVIGGTDSRSLDMSSYKTVVKNGIINNIYGGGESLQVAWSGAVSSTLELEGGIINYVYGGNKGFVGSAAAGDVTLNLSGATVNKDVYGGGYVCTNGMSASAASVTILFTAGTVCGNIYGGGRVHPSYTVYYKDYDTGTIRESSSVATSSVSGNVQITLEGGANAFGNIYLNGSAGQGKTYIDGNDNFIKLSKVYYEHGEPVDPEKPEEGNQTVPTSALAGFTGLLKGNYRSSDGKSHKGNLVFSDYQVEFLGRIDGFEQLTVTDRSNLTLNWDQASRRCKNIGIYRIDEESSLSFTATRKAKMNLNLSGAGTVLLSSAQLYEFTGDLSRFYGTVQVGSGAVMLVKHRNAVLTDNDPKRIATVDLRDGAKLQFSLSATFGAAVVGTEESVITVEKRSNLNLVFHGDLTGFDGTVQLLNSKKAVIEIATTRWDNLNFEVQGNKSWYETVKITAGSGTISTTGYKGMYFLYGNEVNVENNNSTESVIYGGGQEEKVGKTDFTVSSGGTTSFARVFAGGSKSEVEGSASLTVESGNIDELFGGGDGRNAAVNGTSELLVQEGTIGNLYGGGFLSGKGTNTVGHAVIRIENATVGGSIYAGGYALKGATVTVGSAEIIFGPGAQFSGDVYGSGFSDSKSAATVEDDRRITFEDYTGMFHGRMHDFLSFCVKGDTELSFSQAQTGAGSITQFIFDLSGRDEGLGAMLTVSGEDPFHFTGADLIQLTIDRGTLHHRDPGAQQSYTLSDGVVYDPAKTFRIAGLNGSRTYELAIGGELLLNDERYQLLLNDGVLQLYYVIGSADQVSLTWSGEFLDRAAPLSAKRYTAGSKLSFADYGYIDADGDRSLKVELDGPFADFTANASGIDGDLWLNVSGSGGTLSVAPENGTVHDVNLRIAGAWDAVRIGESGNAISGYAWLSLEEEGNVGTLHVGRNVAGETRIYFDGAFASRLDGTDSTIVLFQRNYEALASAFNGVGEIRIGSSSVTMTSGGFTDCGTLSIAGGVFRIAAEEGTVLRIDAQTVTGTGTIAVSSGTGTLSGETSGFSGTLELSGGTLNLTGNGSNFANALLSFHDGTLVYALNGRDSCSITNSLSGNGVLRFENASGGASFTATINTNLKDFSGTFELGENTHAELSGKYGPVTTVSGTLANRFDITGSSYDAEEITELVNKGASVFLNRKELAIRENTGRVFYGGTGDYTAEKHTLAINGDFIPAEESAEFFAGGGAGSVIGEGQSSGSSGTAISVSVSDFDGRIGTLYGGSSGGTVNGEIQLTITSGEIGTLFAAGENCTLSGTVKEEESGEESTVYYNTGIKVSGEETKIGTIYGGAANSGAVNNVSIQISGGEVGSIHAGGTGEFSVKGDVTIAISGDDTAVTGDIVLDQTSGKGTVTLSGSRDDEAGEDEETGLAKLTGTIDGGYLPKADPSEGVEEAAGTGERILTFSSYDNHFNGTFIGFSTVELKSSTVTLKGENKAFRADTVTIDKNSSLIFSGSGSSIHALDGTAASFSGEGSLQFLTDMTFDSSIEKLTGTIHAGMKTVSGTETGEKATLILKSKLSDSVALGGSGNIVLDGDTAEKGTAVKGSFSEDAVLYTNNRNIRITEGTFAGIDLGSTVETMEDLVLRFELTSSKTTTIKKDLFLGETSGESKVVFSGDGSRFSLEGQLYGDENAASNTLAFEDYTGKFTGNLKTITCLELRGDSKVSFYAASSQSGATEFLFDVSGRSSSLASSAMMTLQDNLLFDLAAASERTIIVDETKIGNGGSFVLVTNQEAMTALRDKTFTVRESGSDEAAFELTVDGGSFRWNEFDWKLELNSSGTSLTLSWKRSPLPEESVSAMASTPLTAQELLRGGSGPFQGALASVSLI